MFQSITLLEAIGTATKVSELDGMDREPGKAVYLTEGFGRRLI